MKLYPNLVAGVLEVLEWSFGKGWYADRVVDKVLRANKKWGARDRAFVAQRHLACVFDIVSVNINTKPLWEFYFI